MIASVGWWLSVALLLASSSWMHLVVDYAFGRCISGISPCVFICLVYFCIVHPKLEVL